MFSEGLVVPYLPSSSLSSDPAGSAGPRCTFLPLVRGGKSTARNWIILHSNRAGHLKRLLWKGGGATEGQRLMSSDSNSPPSAALANSFVTTKEQDPVFAAFACMWYHGIIWYYMVFLSLNPNCIAISYSIRIIRTVCKASQRCGRQVGGLLFACMLLGPLIAPPIGGFLATRWDFRLEGL